MDVGYGIRQIDEPSPEYTKSKKAAIERGLF
jgi:hypothetical protein